MDELSHTIGRDPVMDRAVAQVARHLYEFEACEGTDLECAEQLATSSRRLWGATARFGDSKGSPHFRQLRAAIRDLVVCCKETTHHLHLDERIEIETVHREFATVVRRYRTFVLTDQIARFAELPTRWS